MATGADAELAIVLKLVQDELKAGLTESIGQVKAWASGVTSTLKDVADKAENLQHLWTSLFEVEAIKHVVEGLFELASAADEAKDSLEAAAQIASNFGRAVNSEDLEKHAEQLADAYGIPLQRVRDGYRQLALVTSSQAQMDRAAAIAAAFSRARHIEYGEALMIVSRVLTGHVALLSRYGIATKDAAGNILTVNAAMEMMQTAGEKADEVFAKSLPAHLAVLGSHMELLAEDIGDALSPALIKVVDEVTKMVNALRSLSPEAIQLITWVGSSVAIFTSLILALGVVDALVPLITAGFELLVGAVGLLAPLLATDIAAFIGLAAAFILVGNNLGTLKIVWGDFCNFASTAFTEFVNGVLRNGERLHQFVIAASNLLASVVNMDPDGMVKAGQQLGAVIGAAMPKTAKIIVHTLTNAFTNVKTFVVDLFDDLGNWIGRVLTTHMPGLGKKDDTSHVLFDEPGKPDKGGQKAIDDSLRDAKARIDAYLAEAKQRVEDAKLKLATATADLDLFKAKLPDGKVTTAGQAVQEQKLITAEMVAERNVQAELLQQKAKLLQAASEEAAQAVKARSNQNDKDRIQHADELLKLANQHRSAAAQIALEYINVEIAITRLVKSLKDPLKELADQAQQLSESAAEAEADVARRGAEGHREQLRMQQEYAKRGGQPQNQVTEARNADAQAEIALELARIAQALAVQKDEAVRDNPFATPEQVAAADRALADANAALTAAVNNVTLAHKDLYDALQRSKFNLTNVLDTIAQAFSKLVPGLTVQQTGSGGLSAAFSWQSLLVDVLEKTRAWKDVQDVVNKLMKVFATLLNALEPVIDLLLRGLIFLANVVIEIYDTFARLLSLLGIHLQIIDKLNYDFNSIDSSPLIQVIHDLPTLNELASGKVATLSPDATGAGSGWAAPITSAMQDPSLGGGLLGVLEDVLGAILALKLLMATGLLGSSTSAGGIFGTIFNWIGGLFGGGGSGAAAAGPNSGIGFTPGSLAGFDSGSQVAQGFANAFDTNTAGVADTFGQAAGNAISAALGLAGVAIAGVGVGGAIANLLEPGKKDASYGGMIGGLGGALIGAGVFGGSELMGLMLGAWAGPIGIVAGGILGTLIGGLFGPQGQGSQPDLHDPNFGNEQVALTGKPFSTQGFGAGKMPAWVQQLTGGQGLLQYIQSTLAKGQAASGLSTAEYDQLLHRFGTTGGGQIIYGHNIENEQVKGGAAVGNYQTIWDEAVQAAKEIADAFGGFMQPFSDLVANATPIVNAMNTFGNELADSVSTSRFAVGGSAGHSTTIGDTHVDNSITVGQVGSTRELTDMWNAQSEMTARVTRSRAYQIAKVPI